MKLSFGSEEMFSKIKEAVSSGNSELYNQVLEVVYKDVRLLVSRNTMVKADDRDDVVQMAVCKFVSAMPRFCERSGYSENERNGYLKSIVESAVIACWRKNHYEFEVIELKEEVISDKDDIARALANREQILHILRDYVFCANSSVDNIIAAVYNKLLTGNGGKKGSPAAIVEMMEGKTLREAYLMMCEDLQGELEYQIPDNVFEPIRRRVDESPDRSIYLDHGRIPDNTRSFWLKIRKEFFAAN